MKPSSIFVPTIAAFAHSANCLSLPSPRTTTPTVEIANITNFAVTIKDPVVIGESFMLRPQQVACRTEEKFTLPAWLPPTKCNDTSYTFSLGRDESRGGWVVFVNHTLPGGTILSGSSYVPCYGPVSLFCEQFGLFKQFTLTEVV